MSWTLDLERAAWFAGRWVGEAFVFSVTIPPGAVLATLLGAEGRTEHEVIVDPALLPPIVRSAILR